jgi:hypothetical protein
MLTYVIFALCLSCSSGIVFRGQPSAEELQKQIDAAEAETVKLQAQVDDATGHSGVVATKASVHQKSSKGWAKKVVSAANHPVTEEEKMAQLTNGLKAMTNLQDMFRKQQPSIGAEKFANGAMSEELSNKDSQVWTAIGSMLKTVQAASQTMKGKSKADREKMMQSLESDLNSKAGVLSTVTADVSKKQQQQDEEYVLGLLIMHRDNWSMEKQLNATETFMHNSPVLQQLYNHHDASKPLASQLAALMDSKSSVAPAAVSSKNVEKKKMGKVASDAAHAFIQLASNFLQRDCPYCAAQCVDKCHEAGKPYVQCLTDCADAGKSF